MSGAGASPGVDHDRLRAALGGGDGAQGRPQTAIRVPGRIELFGTHTDYSGGAGVVAATEPAVELLVAPRADRRVVWTDVSSGETADFDLVDPPSRPGAWSNYPVLVVRRLGRDFGPLDRGIDVAMASTLPAAAGLASSTALVVAAFLAVDAVHDLGARAPWGRDRRRWAAYLGDVEAGRPHAALAGGEGAGTRGGCQDHAAILTARRGRVHRLRFAPLRPEGDAVLPADWTFVVGVSGVEARKAGAARERYNRLAADAAELTRCWRRVTGRDAEHLGAALELSGGGDAVIETVRAALPETADGRRRLDRCRHFVLQVETLVPAAMAAIEAADGDALGRLAVDSQRAAERWLGNQVPETSALVELARATGAIAASSFGAGFGGAVWAMVRRADADGQLRRWRRAYGDAFPDRRGRFFVTGASGAAAVDDRQAPA